MKQYLQDLVRATSGIDFSVIRVEGSNNETKYQSVADDRTVIMTAVTTEPVDDFKGVFGLSNLSLLAGLAGSKSFKGDDATVTVKTETRDNKQVPVSFIFDNDSGMHGVYRLMSEQAIPNQPKFAGTSFAVTIDEPARQKINEFAEMSGLYAATEDKFTPKIVDGDLIFAIGNENSASHSASVKFASEVGDEYNGGFSWPIAQVLAVLKLADNSNSNLAISNDGILKIDIETGLAKYQFLFPGHN